MTDVLSRAYTTTHLTFNARAWRIRHVESKLILSKEGMKEKISHERRDYKAVVDAPQSKTI